MASVQGRRVYPGDAYGSFAEGDYGKITSGPRSGHWMARPPGSHIGDLDAHTVTEHEDGTITVSPSILITLGAPGDAGDYHGYLEAGVWRSV